jgi:hypothetical protein
MSYPALLDSIQTDPQPPTALPLPLAALWWEKRGDWDKAHQLSQEASSAEGDWVHAYLHRREGDQANAAYWYNRAGKPVATIRLDAEWEAIAKALLMDKTG